MEIIPTSCLPSSAYGIVERYRAEVGLQISGLVVADSYYMRYWQLALGEVTRQIDERVVLVTACADDTDDMAAVLAPESEVFTVTALAGKFLNILGLAAVMSFLYVY